MVPIQLSAASSAKSGDAQGAFVGGLNEGAWNTGGSGGVTTVVAIIAAAFIVGAALWAKKH